MLAVSSISCSHCFWRAAAQRPPFVRGDPDRSPATKADMKNYVMDSYHCSSESEQEIRFGQLPWARQRDAQGLYEMCMRARGYDVQHR